MIVAGLGVITAFGSCNPQPETKVEVTVSETVQPTLTVAEINSAQQAWCDALVEI